MRKNKSGIKISINKNPKNKSKKQILNDLKNEDNFTKGISILNNYKKKLNDTRERLKGKTIDEYHEEIEQEEEIAKKKKYVLMCGIVIIVFLFIYIFFRYGPIYGISLSKNIGLDEESKINIVSTEEDIYLNYNNELLIYSNKELSTYNANLKKTWKYTFEENFTPKIYICGSYMVVSNNSSGKIYLFNGHKEILNKQIEGIINNIYLDKYGNMAIEYSSSGYKKIIGVYDSKGRNKYNTYLSNGAIIDIKLLEKGNKLIIAQTESSSFKIGFNLLSVDGTKENEINQLVAFDNNLLYNLTIQDKNIIMLLDNGIVSYNINTNEVKDIKKFESDQMLFIALANNYYTYISKDLSNIDGKYNIKTDRFDGTNIGSVEVENSPKTMKNTGVLNYFVYQTSMQVINKWSLEVKKVDIDFPPKEIIVFNNEKTVALIYTNKVYFVNI